VPKNHGTLKHFVTLYSFYSEEMLVRHPTPKMEDHTAIYSVYLQLPSISGGRLERAMPWWKNPPNKALLIFCLIKSHRLHIYLKSDAGSGWRLVFLCKVTITVLLLIHVVHSNIRYFEIFCLIFSIFLLYWVRIVP